MTYLNISLTDAVTPRWVKYSISHTALQTAAVTNTLTVASLPIGAVVHGAVMKFTEVFAGTATYTLSLGIAGSLAKYLPITDAKAALAATTFAIPAATFVAGPESFGAAVSIVLSAVSTVQNLDQSSAGAVDVYLLTSQLP